MPFAANLRDGRPVLRPSAGPVAPDPEWAASGVRLAERVARAGGAAARAVAHVGPTAVPGLPAADVLDVHLAVAKDADPETVRAGLAAAGFPPLRPDRGGGGPAGEWRHAGADPGRPVRVHVSPAGAPAWRGALLWRDWLRDDAAARAQYARAAVLPGAAVRHRFEADAVARAEEWAAASGWSPPSDAADRGRVVA